MKKIFLLFIFCTLHNLCFSQNDIATFPELQWGMSVEEVKNIVKLESKQSKDSLLTYKIECDSLNENATIAYIFTPNYKLRCILYLDVIDCDDFDDFSDKYMLRYDSFINRFGEPVRNKDLKAEWIMDETKIIFIPSKRRESGLIISLIYKPLYAIE